MQLRSDLGVDADDRSVTRAIAEQHQVSPARVIVRWNLQHGWVPIPKSHYFRDGRLAPCLVAC